MITEERPSTEVGTGRLRKEDRHLLVGQTRWTDNMLLPAIAHIAMVRSPFAHVGGAFGGKLQFTPEEVLSVIAARRTGRTCKYTETRTESMSAR